MAPATAYILTAVGILLVYAELIRPGAILPGSAGLVLFGWGAHALYLCSLRPLGVFLCLLAACLFTAEWLFRTYKISGAAGALLLAVGSFLLCRPQIPAAVATTGGLVVGVASWFLAAKGRMARFNKTISADKELERSGARTLN